jgi:hypothetical protein
MGGKMSDGLWGFSGVIIGSLITFLSQYFFEKRQEKLRNRKLFIDKYLKIYENIFNPTN